MTNSASRMEASQKRNPKSIETKFTSRATRLLQGIRKEKRTRLRMWLVVDASRQRIMNESKRSLHNLRSIVIPAAPRDLLSYS